MDETAPVVSAKTAERGEVPCILVVEDDCDTQLYMQTFLKGRYQLLFAATGVEAREQLGRHGGGIRLILMDLSLKGEEDGISLTRFVRQQEAFRQIPIIATTAHAFPKDERAALAAGCDAYLAKPFDQKRLLASMATLMTGKPMPDPRRDGR
jgi:CheY-like chemotaxis protein